MAKSMTMAELKQEAEAAEAEAIKAETPTATIPDSVPPVVDAEPTPAPVVAPAPAPASNAELDAAKSKLADVEAQLAEMTKRVRDADGQRGGELSGLKSQVERLGDQLRDVMKENRELRAKPVEAALVAKADPDPLDTEYPEVAKSIGNRMKPINEVAVRAEDLAKATKQELYAMREQRFLEDLEAAIPDLAVIDRDVGFNTWLDDADAGSPIARRQMLMLNRQNFDSRKTVALIKRWQESKPKQVEPVVEPAKAKPSKESQVELPKNAAAASPHPASTKPDATKMKARYRQLNDKIFKGVGGPVTKDDRDEYDRLVEAEERGELN